MKHAKGFLAFVVIIGMSTTAVGQDARQVEIGYEITFAGMSGFRVDVTARFNGPRYDIESIAFKEGILKAVTIRYLGRNRAWGQFSSQGVKPTAGSLSILVDDKPRTWLVQYGEAGTLSETHDPEWNPTGRQIIRNADREGSLDPLSAALSVSFAGNAACDATVHSNDGKRRVDVLFRKVGMEPAAATGIPGAIGDVLVCEIYTKRIAGEFDDAPKETETERERPIKMWLARFDNTQIRYPGKLEVQTAFAKIVGRILWFRERPLTLEEAKAMR